MDNTFVELLRQALENQSPVGVFCDPNDPAAFAAGWVEAVTDEHILLRHMSPHGRYDGYRLLNIEDIFRVDSTGRYLERLRLLSQVREERFPRLFKTEVEENANLLTETLLAVQSNEWLVRIFVLDGDDEAGWIKNVAHDTVTITRVDHFGVADFEATVHLEAISEMHCDDEELQDLRLLARRNETEPPAWLKI
jgi:hypothetical protein